MSEPPSWRLFAHRKPDEVAVVYGTRSLRWCRLSLDVLDDQELEMAHLTPAAHVLLATQHGVASVNQLIDSGLTARQVRHLEQRGSLIGVLRGAYRSPSTPFDELGRCAAVCLARPDVAIAGPTAGRLWGFRRLPPDKRIHVLAPPASQPAIAAWVVPYRTAAVHAEDIVQRDDGIRITSRARTALDLARWLHPGDLLSVVEQAVHDGRLGDQEMFEVAVDWQSPRRPWIRQYLRALDQRLPGGAAESHPEVRVAHALERVGVRGLVRQFRIDLPGYGPARFDLAIPAMRWAIEIDVHPAHEETRGSRSDRARDAAARRLAWTVTRVTRRDYEERFQSTIGALAERYTGLRRAS